MRPLIDPQTEAYLKSLEGKPDVPDFYHGQRDAVDQLIYEEGLLIKSVWFDQDLDLMVVLLNNRKILQLRLSEFPKFSGASLPQLLDFENHGTGIHWPALDEDLSLRGFLLAELARIGERVVH